MLSEFWSNLFITDSLYAKFVLHEFAKTQKSRKARTPCTTYFLLLHHMCVILQACEPAAKLALEDVNAKSDLLPGYTLRLHWNDSGVSIFQSLCIFCSTLVLYSTYSVM